MLKEISMDLTAAERLGIAACGLFLIGVVTHPHFAAPDRQSSPFDDVLPRARRIPKIIYKTGSLPETSPLIFPLFADFTYKNPTIALKYFNDSESSRYVREQCGNRAGDAYNAVRGGGMRADLFRYCVLWKFGGVYGDLSQRYRVPLHLLVDFYRDRLVLIRGQRASYDLSQHRVVGTSFMAAVPGHPLLRLALDTAVSNIEAKFYGAAPADVTGAGMFSAILDKNQQYNYKMELKDEGKTIAQIQMGQPVIINNVGGTTKVRARLGNATSSRTLWVKRALYDFPSTGISTV